MRIDRTKLNMMPILLGPLYDLQNRPALTYANAEFLTLQFKTDPQAITRLLPDCYKPGPEPSVTVYFVQYEGVDFMAGNGYRMAAVEVSARFDGVEDHVDGNYVLVMPEDHALPIIMGREASGMTKIPAEISVVRTLGNGHLRCEAPPGPSI